MKSLSICIPLLLTMTTGCGPGETVEDVPVDLSKFEKANTGDCVADGNPCDYCHRGGVCPGSWSGDGECDCECHEGFVDSDCPDDQEQSDEVDEACVADGNPCHWCHQNRVCQDAWNGDGECDCDCADGFVDSDCPGNDDEEPQEDCEAPSGFFYVSSRSVENLHGSLESVRPSCQQADPGHACEFYLQGDSCLGPHGPISAYGPLGEYGPTGNNLWNPSIYITGMGDWSDWAEDMKLNGGVMSEDGPLGPDGPLGDVGYHQNLPAINDWAKHLQAGGVWTVLGPLGPSGPLGPLGPLGPTGGHGYPTEHWGHGAYIHEGQVMRTYEVPVPLSDRSSQRVYELVEMYKEEQAKSMTDNDTSCVIMGEIWPEDEEDTYTFTSHHNQFVTVTVVPTAYSLIWGASKDDYDLVIRKPNGHELIRADSRLCYDHYCNERNQYGYVDWVQFKAYAGMQFTVTVNQTNYYLSNDYRLIVVGSTEHFQSADICGDHQVAFDPY